MSEDNENGVQSVEEDDNEFQERNAVSLGSENSSDDKLFDSDEDDDSAIFSNVKMAEDDAADDDDGAEGDESEDDPDDEDFGTSKKAAAATAQQPNKKSRLSALSAAELAVFHKDQKSLRKKQKTFMQSDRCAIALADYIFVVVFNEYGSIPNVRETILKEQKKDKGARTAALARAITEIEALFSVALALARKAHPEEMQELCDFVKDVADLTVQESITANGRCAVSQRDLTASELVDVSATLAATGKRKHIIIAKKLVDLLQAINVALNLLAILGERCTALLLASKRAGFDVRNCTVNEAYETLVADGGVENARQFLQTALSIIDVSGEILKQE